MIGQWKGGVLLGGHARVVSNGSLGLGKSARSVGLILRVGDQGLIPGTTWFTPAVLGVALNSYHRNLKWQVVQMGRCQGEGYRVVEGTTRHREDLIGDIRGWGGGKVEKRSLRPPGARGQTLTLGSFNTRFLSGITKHNQKLSA